jgi:hypothetical protein
MQRSVQGFGLGRSGPDARATLINNGGEATRADARSMVWRLDHAPLDLVTFLLAAHELRECAVEEHGPTLGIPLSDRVLTHVNNHKSGRLVYATKQQMIPILVVRDQLNRNQIALRQYLPKLGAKASREMLGWAIPSPRLGNLQMVCGYVHRSARNAA